MLIVDRESEQFSLSIINALSAHLCVLDETGTIVAVNKAWRDYAERNSSGPTRTAEGANYLSVCDTTMGEFVEQAQAFATGIRAVLNGEQEHFACDYYCPSSTRPGWFSGRVMQVPGAGPVRLVVTHEDITDRKKAEKALQESEARFRAIFEQVAVGAAYLNLDGRFLQVNQKFCDILGYTQDELQQRFCFDVTHPDDRDATEKGVGRVMVGEIPSFVVEKRYIRKNGTAVWVTQTGVLVRAFDSTPLYFVDVIEDISRRKQLEDAQQRLVDILENTSDYVSTTTAEGRGIYLNRAGRSLLGLDADADLSQWVPLAAYTQRSGELMCQHIVPHGLQNGTWAGEATLMTRSGQEIPVSQVVIAHKGEDGRARYVSVIARDISEQKKTEEALQALSRRILDAQEQERRHLARELHDELGQVLSALKLTLQNIQRRPASMPTRIEESIGMTQHALEQIRTLSRNLRPLMLDDLGLVAALRWYTTQHARLTSAHVEFIAEMPDLRFSPAVETVCFRVAQEALTNIMRHAQARHVWVDLHYRDGELQLSVRDDGVGFDESAVPMQATQGAGSGLLGMRERAQLVKGNVRVSSARDGGTEVRAVFPVTLDDEQTLQTD